MTQQYYTRDRLDTIQYPRRCVACVSTISRHVPDCKKVLQARERSLEVKKLSDAISAGGWLLNIDQKVMSHPLIMPEIVEWPWMVTVKRKEALRGLVTGSCTVDSRAHRSPGVKKRARNRERERERGTRRDYTKRDTRWTIARRLCGILSRFCTTLMYSIEGNPYW